MSLWGVMQCVLVKSLLGKTRYESDITDSHASSFNHAENQHITFLLCLFAGFTAVPQGKKYILLG